MRSRHLRLALLAALCVPPASAQEAVRFRCTLVDGSVRLFMHDLGKEYGMGVRACQPVAVPAAADRPFTSMGRPAGREWTTGSATDITAPSTGRLTLSMPRRMPADLAHWVHASSRRHGVDPALPAAVMYVESRFQPEARSPKGALGLMQVIPPTAARFGVHSRAELMRPQVNIEVGVRYLRYLMDMFPGRIDLVAAAYNAGEGAVLKYGRRVPPYAETQNYVQQVMSLLGARAGAL